jgi:predicted ATPase
MLTQIKVSNFKSFKDATINLEKFNLLIGSNATGKSNFLNIFRFLNDIANLGLNDAISNQGGVKYLKNLKMKNDIPLKLEIKSQRKFGFPIKENEVPFFIEIFNVDYGLSLNFIKDSEYYIIHEYVELKGIIKELNIKNTDKNKKQVINVNNQEKGNEYSITIKISNKNSNDEHDNLEVKLDSKSKIPIKIDNIFPSLILDIIKKQIMENKNISLFQTPLANFPIDWKSIFKNFKFYDIDPKKCKQLTKINGNNQLKENGENLAVVIQEIFNNENQKRKFLNLVRDLIPAVQDISTEKLIDDNSLIFKIKEEYLEDLDDFIPGWMISDGTSNIFSLIIALYFVSSSLTLIEEPERNLHPKIISMLVQMIEESSKKKQVIVTTHDAEILKHTNTENIFFISRNNEGFSTISKPCDNEEVKMFLEEEIGIEDLFIDDLLE